VISRFDRSSPLSSAGLRRGDAIISVNGRRVTSQGDFQRWVFGARRPAVVVWRNGRERTIYLNDLDNYYMGDTRSQRPTLGVVIDERVPDEVVIDNVYRNGPAEEAGLRRGDTIVSIDRHEVRDLQDLRNTLARYEPGDEVDVHYLRNNREDVAVARLDSNRSRYNNRATYDRVNVQSRYYDGPQQTYYRGSRIYDNDGYYNNSRYYGQDLERRGVLGRRVRPAR
jgi:S1-C subfamily serine protease